MISRHDLAAAIRERESGRRELLEQVLAMAPDQRAKLAPEAFLRLGPKGLSRLMEPSALPKSEPVPAASTTAAAGKPKDRYHKSIVGWQRTWYSTPPELRAAVAGLTMASLTAIIMSSSFWAYPRLKPYIEAQSIPSSWADWPECPRLSDTVDICLYPVQVGLSWQAAADDLGVDVDSLQRANPQLKNHIKSIPSDSVLVIDRAAMFPEK